MIPRYQYPSINDIQNQVSMIPRYQYPSINDTQNQVSMIPRYQYPIINDTQNQVSRDGKLQSLTSIETRTWREWLNLRNSGV